MAVSVEPFDPANPLMIFPGAQLDREQFRPVMDEFYALHGWDLDSDWPTRERLRELNLQDVYEPIVGGASKARSTG